IIINLIIFILQQAERSDTTPKDIQVSSKMLNKHAYIEIRDNFTHYRERAELSDDIYSAMNWGDDFSLGMVIVKQVVDRFKGTVCYMNDTEQNALFQICFPAIISKQKGAQQ
ncbi:MAG: ATP-binding protein, partial [Candidatus Cloacimonetes bacterium]|nr:ATP-binding protein [Candidatus Cloacimonadota bacterium]